ncbi:hypothetical protein AB0D66_28270 [Streptomyces sp. NPDC048270]|uniref:hypothetical protein n=1 Tax=Streptomyces sp. NPDC048270 TaxID=3154615 RepID=UPI0033D85325
MIRLIRPTTLSRLLRAAATARHEARTAHRELAELHGRYRALVSHLARREPALLLPVPVPAATANDDHVGPLPVLLLMLWHQAAAEREAFRGWVTEEPPLVAAAELLARAAEAASAAARKDST